MAKLSWCYVNTIHQSHLQPIRAQLPSYSGILITERLAIDSVAETDVRWIERILFEIHVMESSRITLQLENRQFYLLESPFAIAEVLLLRTEVLWEVAGIRNGRSACLRNPY